MSHTDETKEKIRQSVKLRYEALGRSSGKWERLPAVCKTCSGDFIAARRTQLYCCAECKPKQTVQERRAAQVLVVSKRRRKLKEMAVEHKGGCCERCGYSKCIAALEFHHIDPEEKDFSISHNGRTRSWEAIKAELDKCTLVCANCHRELHE